MLASLTAVWLGYPVLDPIGGIVIAVLIARTGWEIGENASRILTTPAARMIARGGERPLLLEEVEALLTSNALVVDACRIGDLELRQTERGLAQHRGAGEQSGSRSLAAREGVGRDRRR